MSDAATGFWKKCSSCKQPIAYGAKYYVCSVSTCNGPRLGYVFCSMNCFESHVPGARHRDAGAVQKVAPASAEATPLSQRPNVRLVSRPGEAPPPSAAAASIAREVLVIASRLKDYVQARSEMNTSASVMDALSDHLRVICDRGIENARADGRKTLMDRDFEFLKGR